MTNGCVKLDLDLTPETDYILASMIDMYVEGNFSACSIQTYYEECGTIGERLALAIQNEMIVNICTKMIELEN